MPGGFARAAYYDRNPVKKSLIDARAGVAPHAEASQGAYTVPNGRLFNIESGFAAAQQTTAATTAGNVNAQVRVVQADVNEPFGPKVFEGYKFNLALGSQTAPAGATAIGWVMKAGDVATMSDADQSIGGQCVYDASLSGCEFDA